MTTVDGVANFRDVGGLPLTSGGKTATGVLFRSAALGLITDTGLQELAATPIGVIVDLRTVSEREFQPDVVPQIRPFTQVDLPLQTGNLNPDDMLKHFPGGSTPDFSKLPPEQLRALAQKFEDNIPSFDSMYETLLQTGAESFAKTAQLTARFAPGTDTAVLVHCTAGKDRTGVSCALILDAVGVERDAIIDNYALSQKNLAGPWAEGMLAHISGMGIPLVPQLVAITTTTPPEAIEHALGWVDQKFGSSTDYLKSGGLTNEDIDQLHAALTS